MNESVEKVLAVLDGFRTSDEITYSAYSALYDEISLLDDLLKEHEARVLTTDELFYMEHQGVYIERRNSQLYETEPAIVLRTSACGLLFGGTEYILMRENKFSESRWVCDYNKDRRNGWRCWTSKPTEEQRRAVKWDE